MWCVLMQENLKIGAFHWPYDKSMDLKKLALPLENCTCAHLRKLSKITLLLGLTLRKSDLKITAMSLRSFLKVRKFLKVIKVLSGGCQSFKIAVKLRAFQDCANRRSSRMVIFCSTSHGYLRKRRRHQRRKFRI